MNALKEKIGLHFEPFTFTVERGKIKEFAMAIGDDNPIYYDVKEAIKAGHRDIPIPPTFATCIEMWAGANFDQLMEKLELNPLKVLHGEQAYEYLEEVCAGDILHGRTFVKHVESKKNMVFITLQTDFTNEDGKKVLMATSTIIERGEVKK